MSKTQDFTYEFENINYVDFELDIQTEIKASIFQQLYLAVVKKLPKNVQEKIKGKDAKDFDIGLKYHNYLKVILKNTINKINAELKADKHKIVDYHVEKASFLKNNADWLLKIRLKGNYIEAN